MSDPNYYQTLQVTPKATQAEIKQAYRRLAKQFHPDTLSATANHEEIIRINTAYEVIGNPQSRRIYDQQLQLGSSYESVASRQERTAQAQKQYYHQRQREQNADRHWEEWLQEVYIPVNSQLSYLLSSLNPQLEELAADPFDDQLMADFESYLEGCRIHLEQAQHIFASQPNPGKVAKVAALLYYCLNHISDGIDELAWFPLNYDEHYLHRGQELFRIATRLRQEASEAIESLV